MFVCLQRRKIKGRHEKKYFKIISLNEAEKYAGVSEFSLRQRHTSATAPKNLNCE